MCRTITFDEIRKKEILDLRTGARIELDKIIAHIEECKRQGQGIDFVIAELKARKELEKGGR